LHTTIPELLIKGVPEGFLDVLSIYVLTGTRIKAKSYVIQSIITILVIYLIRLLPIIYGVNSILALTFFAIFFAIFYKMDFSRVIKAAIITIIIIFLSEMINVFLLRLIFGSEQTQALFADPLKKSIAGIPSTVLFGAFVYVSHRVIKKLDRKRKARDGDTGEETGL
jgi:hypothetical protein